MNNRAVCDPKASPGEIQIADLLLPGVWLAVGVTVPAFILYAAGVWAGFRPPRMISLHWSKPAAQYVQDLGVPAGWGWMDQFSRSDSLIFAGIILMMGVQIVGLTVLIPEFSRHRNWGFLAMVTIQLLVLCLAAAGVGNLFA